MFYNSLDINSLSKASGLLTIDGARVALALRKISDDKTEITISARRFMLPRMEIAAGVLYQIVDKM